MDPSAASDWKFGQNELYSLCLLLIFVARDVGSIEEIALFGVRNSKQLYERLQK